VNAELKRKHFVHFQHTKEKTSYEEIEERNLSEIVIPPSVLYFHFYDQIVGFCVENDKKFPINSDILDQSPRHYYGGKIYNHWQIERDRSDLSILLFNMRHGGHKEVILCENGDWHLLNDEDIFIKKK